MTSARNHPRRSRHALDSVAVRVNEDGTIGNTGMHGGINMVLILENELITKVIKIPPKCNLELDTHQIHPIAA